MTGLDDLVARVMSLPGFTRWAGMRVVRIELGQVDLEIDRNPDLLQFNGFFHGGVIAALADHAAGAAASSTLPDGRIAVTVSLQMSYLAPADGQSLLARARTLGGGSNLSVATVEVLTRRDGTERMCAFATVTLRAVAMSL